MSFKRYASDDDSANGVWRTIGGRRVFIKDGQDLASAMKESGKFKPKYKKKMFANNEEFMKKYQDKVENKYIKEELRKEETKKEIKDWEKEYEKQEQIVHEAKNEVDKLKRQLSLLENDDTYESPDYDETKYALQDAEDRYREEKAKYDKMNNKSFNTEDEAFIKDLTEHYDEFTRGDLQGVIEAKYGMGEKGQAILKEVDDRTYEKYKVDYDYEKEMPTGAKFSKMLKESGAKTFADEIKESETGYKTYLRDRYGIENEDIVSAGNKSKEKLYQEYKNETIRRVNKERMTPGVRSLEEAYKRAYRAYLKDHPNSKMTFEHFKNISE